MAYPLPMGRRPGVILLDMDGTLVDSFPGITEALNIALEDEGMSPVDLPWVREHVGRGARALVEDAARRGGAPERAGALLEAFRSAYGELFLHRSPPFPGVEATLRELGQGHRLAVISNKPLDWTLRLVEHLGWGDLFAAVEGPESAGARKPDPAMVHAVLGPLGLSPWEALVVGDMEVDVETGLAAGTPVVGVSCGARPAEALLGAGAVAVLPDLTALPSWLEDGRREVP